MKLEILANAKINLALSIEGKREDGYHEVWTILQSVGLSDSLIIEESKRLVLTCNEESLACDETNLVMKAARALQAYTQTRKGAAMRLHKRIPMAAGLAGGSSDAAAALRGLNEFWKLDLSLEELKEIARTLGSDVPFCLEGGTAFGTGRGDELEYLPDMPEAWLLIAHPPIPVHTTDAYALFDSGCTTKTVKADAVRQAVEAGDWEIVKENLGNTFEDLVFPRFPEIEACKKELEQRGIVTLMSGSGPTLYGFIHDAMQGYTLQGELRDLGYDWDYRITRTTQRGAMKYGKG